MCVEEVEEVGEDGARHGVVGAVRREEEGFEVRGRDGVALGGGGNGCMWGEGEGMVEGGGGCLREL